MAVLKKPEPKKCGCARPEGGTVTGVSMFMGSGRTLESGPEDIARRSEMNKVQLDMMKADLRLHIAQADLAEFTAARAKAEFRDYLALRHKRSARK